MILFMMMLGCTGTRTPINGGQPSSVVDTLSVYAHIKRQLDSIGVEDQRFREQLHALAMPRDSQQIKIIMDSMVYVDSLNLRIVSHIIDTYGWLGADVIGADANGTLFMVIQHSDLSDQQKYLPLMRAAVAAGKARGSSLALLEDRVAIGEGRKQVYGSQLSWSVLADEYYVVALEDPDHVDERRAAIGLVPMAVYVSECCNVVWNVEACKNNQGLKKRE